MASILIIFFSLSLCFSLILTPLIRKVAFAWELLDQPTGRKVHTRPLPRLGGLAIYVAFWLSFWGGMIASTSMRAQIVSNFSLPWVFGGATLVFLMGWVDDVRRLKPGIKLTLQLAAALMAYKGGIGIQYIDLPWHSMLTLGWFSLPVTVLWFLMIINGLNLIDGLDGLAAGVAFFASLALLMLSIMGGHPMEALWLASLAGACLGFLRYNFNPASIFMGDSGSYFLGYMLATLSLLSSMKTPATVPIHIPIIVLGIPLFDITIAPIRRFILGKNSFKPDRDHVHHKLLEKGMPHRDAVLLMYGITILLGGAAVIIAIIHEKAAALMLILGVCAVLGARKLGYTKHIAFSRVIRYVMDIADEAGLRWKRRAFLDRQIAINEAHNADEMWERVVDAMEFLKFDVAQIQFDGVCFAVPEDKSYKWCKHQIPEQAEQSSSITSDNSKDYEHRIFSIEVPLLDDQKRYATLILKKDLVIDPITHHTLKRIEHLRRTIVRKLRMLDDQERQAGDGNA